MEYPEVIAVIVAVPDSLVVLIVAYSLVLPPFMVSCESTLAMIVFDEDKLTITSPIGALAGFPLLSCN